MGADIKNLRVRIRSVNSTLHLTKAMGLVASSKIRRANASMINGQTYAKSVGKIIDDLTACPECKKSPYMRTVENPRIRLIVIAGDRGMCGGYNANIFRLMRDFNDVQIIPIGKRACDRYGNGYTSSEFFSRQDGSDLAAGLCKDFINGEYDKLGIFCSKYISVMTQIAEVKWILPIERKTGKSNNSILFEPGESEILNSAIPEYVSAKIIESVRESFACEVAARRMAMDSAGKNAQKMISDLTLSYNRARQSTITQEITEIVAGSDE